MRILVTGGAGYIGSHAVQLLTEHGHEVVVFDNLSMGHAEALTSQVPLIRGDVRDFSALHQAVAEAHPEVVMHFAGLALVGESMLHPERYFEVNVTGGLNLLRAMLENGVRRLIFSSTCATYGVPHKLPLEETMLCQPINPYGASKRMFEEIVSWFGQRHGFSSVIFRYFNAAGCWGGLGEDHTPETHLVPNVLRAALGQTKAIEVYGTDYPTPDGTCLRDFIHVRDVARAHVLAAESEVTGLFNLGTGQPVSVQQVVDVACQVTGRKIPANYLPRREGDPPALYANPEKAERELGWRAEHSELPTMIQQAWEWMRVHPHGYSRA